jgi:hypothetical protein
VVDLTFDGYKYNVYPFYFLFPSQDLGCGCDREERIFYLQRCLRLLFAANSVGVSGVT